MTGFERGVMPHRQARPMSWFAGAARAGASIGVFALCTACGPRGAIEINVPPADALGPMTATPRNVILAVGGTQQLQVTAASLTGAPVTQFDSVLYVLNALTDSGRVTVTRGGLVSARATSGVVPVNAVAYWNGTVRGDQILVEVTPAVISGLTLSIQPPPGDSARLASGTAKTIVPVLRNAAGASLTGMQLQYEVRKEDDNRMTYYEQLVRLITTGVSGGFLRPPRTPGVNLNQIMPLVGEGTVWVYANIMAYGTALRDSVLYTLSYPYTGTVVTNKTGLTITTSINGGSPSLPAGLTGKLVLAPGAIITFSNTVAATDPLTITYTFDTPAAATAPATSPSTTGGASGNITPLAGTQTSRRQFLTAGTYHWTTIAAGGPAPWPGQTFYGTIVIK